MVQALLNMGSRAVVRRVSSYRGLRLAKLLSIRLLRASGKCTFGLHDAWLKTKHFAWRLAVHTLWGCMLCAYIPGMLPAYTSNRC